jgi:xanthine permease XanP
LEDFALAERIVKHPPNITYGVDNVLPFGVTLVSGLQHVGLNSIFLIFPLLVTRETHLPAQASLDILSWSMLALAVGSILQALPRGQVGARFLCPSVFTAAYLGPSLAAVKTGGLALVFGMTAFGGLVEVALSSAMRRLRPYFTVEISGFIVMMIGVAVGAFGLRSILGIETAEPIDGRSLTIAAITLATMVGLNVWTKGATRYSCALIGMAVGYVLAAGAGLITSEDWESVQSAPLAHIPSVGHLGWSFDVAAAVPFLVAALATSIRVVGDVTICQRTNDADWVRPDMQSLSRGMLANGLGNITAGVLGTIGLSTSTSSIAMAAATGVTSRRVAYAIGAMFVLFTFMPKISAILLIMPAPVVSAALLFSAAVIFVNGLQIIASRLLDARRTFAIGLGFVVGLAVDLYPASFTDLPAWLTPFFSSSLVLGTTVALLLNAVFRLGLRQTQTLTFDPKQFDVTKVEEFIETQGAAWGARRDVVGRASFSVAQSLEVILGSCEPQGPLEIEGSFDEFNLDVRVSYPGAPLELPDKRPSNEEILASDEGERRLAGFILRRYADRVAATHRAGRSTIIFHFDH